LKKPDLRLAIEINRRVRSDDELFEEPDDLDRVAPALRSIEGLVDPLEAAALVAFRVARAQGFAEGNKRRLSCWLDGFLTTTVSTVG
jgi:prophage maintenance system killer protein